MVEILPGDRFGTYWVKELIRAWNTSDDRQLLGGLGSVAFFVIDRANGQVRLNWAEDGTVTLLDLGAEVRVALSASYDVWMEFIEGESSAPALVLRGKVRVTGDDGVLLRFTRAFGALASVAHGVSPTTR